MQTGCVLLMPPTRPQLSSFQHLLEGLVALQSLYPNRVAWHAVEAVAASCTARPWPKLYSGRRRHGTVDNYGSSIYYGSSVGEEVKSIEWGPRVAARDAAAVGGALSEPSRRRGSRACLIEPFTAAVHNTAARPWDATSRYPHWRPAEGTSVDVGTTSKCKNTAEHSRSPDDHDQCNTPLELRRSTLDTHWLQLSQCF